MSGTFYLLNYKLYALIKIVYKPSIKNKLIKLIKVNSWNVTYKNINLIKLLRNNDLLFQSYNRIKEKGYLNRRKSKILKNIQTTLTTYCCWSFKATKKESSEKEIFKYKVLKEALRIILQSIYGPILKKVHFCQTIKHYIRRVKKIDCNVNLIYSSEFRCKKLKTRVFLRIVRKKILDNRLLELIKNLLLSNLVYGKNIKNEHNNVNILFLNIYLHMFDIYIKSKLKILRINSWKWNTFAYVGFYNRLKKQIRWSNNWKLKNVILKWDILKIKIWNQLRLHQVTYVRYLNHWFLWTSLNNFELNPFFKKIYIWSGSELSLNVKTDYYFVEKKTYIWHLLFLNFIFEIKTKKVSYHNNICIWKKRLKLSILG